jgi:hypothetical protein
MSTGESDVARLARTENWGQEVDRAIDGELTKVVRPPGGCVLWRGVLGVCLVDCCQDEHIPRRSNNL